MLGIVSEKKRNAPYCGQGDDCVDNSAEKRVLSAEDPSHNVKAEKANTAPVKSTDNG